jgi:hypothetical protein
MTILQRPAGLAHLPLLVLSIVAAVAGRLPAAEPESDKVELIGTIIDTGSNRPIPARVYVHAPDGCWLFVESTSPNGSALPYREEWVPMPGSVEKHTTLSAHPFRIELAPGRYEIVIERGKEYLPLNRTITMGPAPRRETFRLVRWIDMARRGWYSGETHVHRRIGELANVMPAEDLNVAFPVTFWTTKAFSTPDLEPSSLRSSGPSPFGSRDDRGTKPIVVDPTHVIYPRNTEYEVFSVDGKGHVLGSIALLNHRSILTAGAPPIGPIAAQVHQEGGLIDLEKHNWPWSMMLVPIAKVDLYQLANNSMWRTEFGFRQSPIAPAETMDVETDERGMTEWGWLQFGLQNYYMLLNCGFRLQPTAGTASGVHPVPLGFSRVYVQLPGQFDSTAWIDGLRGGRSFVTNGPMLLAQVEGQPPGHRFVQTGAKPSDYRLEIEALSPRPLERIEIVVNGQIRFTLKPENTKTPDGAYLTQVRRTLPIGESSWIVARCFQFESNRRPRFAHTAPWHVQVAGQPVRPRRAEVEYLVGIVQDQIERNQGVLPDAAIAEFRRALEVYKEIARRAR